MKTNNLVLVVGVPRSGTTLLQAMLMRIEGLWFPPETHFFEATWLRRKRAIALANATSREQYLRIVHDQVCVNNELDVDWPLLRQQLCDAQPDLAHWFDTLLQHLKQRAPNCQRIGEKSPNHLQVADYLLREFEDCKVINVIRDGRDVAVSTRDSLHSPLSVAHLALRWRYYQQLHHRLAVHWSAARYASVRYEALVLDPEPELKKLCAFLGERFTSDMLEPHKRESLGFAARETHKQRTMQPITAARIGRYRDVLTPTEIATFQIIAGANLRRMSYVLDKVPMMKAWSLLPMEIGRVAARRFRWHRSLARLDS